MLHPAWKLVDTLTRYAPHNTDDSVAMTEVRHPENELEIGVKIRANKCLGIGKMRNQHDEFCTACVSRANSVHLHRAAINLIIKLDALMYFVPLADGDMESMDTFLKEVNNRDYISLSEVNKGLLMDYLNIEDTMMLHKKLTDAFYKVNTSKMTRNTKSFVELIVRKLLDERKDDNPERKAKRVLRNAFAREIMSGTINKSNIDYAALHISGELDDHELIPGLLEGYMCHQRLGNFWRRGVKGGLCADRTDDPKVAEAEAKIGRATFYFMQRMTGVKLNNTLKALNLHHGKSYG